MHVTLEAAADDAEGRRVGARQVAGGDGSRCCRADGGDFPRVHHCQWRPLIRVTHDQRPLDRGQAVPLRITGEVAVRLGHEIRTIAGWQHAGLHVKTAVRDAQRRYGRRGRLAAAMEFKGPLDDLDAFGHIERITDIATGEDESAAVSHSQVDSARGSTGPE